MTDHLPNGWELAAVTEVADPLISGFASGAKTIAGGLRHLRMNNITDECELDLRLIRTVPPALRRERYLLQPGDILCCTTNSGRLVGKVCLFDQAGEWAFSNHITRIRPKKDLVDPRWLYFSLRQLWERGVYQDLTRNWVNQSTLPKEELSACEVPVPPLAEQRRIVEQVEALLACVNAARERLARVRTILKRLRQSVLSAACSGRLTEDWRYRRGTTGTIDAGEFPGGWRWRPLKETCEKFQYGSSAKSDKTGKVPVLRMGNLQNGEIDWGNLVYSSDPEEIKKYELPPKTVLFNRTNSLELVGKTAIYRGERPAIYAGYLIRIHHGKEINPEYLNYCLNAPEFREYCSGIRTDGVSQSNINAKKLAEYEIPWCSMEEQAEIVRRVEALFKLADQIERHLSAASSRADKLTQSILREAFSGKL